MGFQFKYTLEDMFRGAIETCRAKGFIPHSTRVQANGHEKESLPNTAVADSENGGSLPNSTENGTNKEEK